MVETEVFGKQLYSVEESTCDFVGTFWRPPQCFSAPVVIRLPGNFASLAPPSLHPCTLADNLPVSDKNALNVPIFFGHRPNFLLCSDSPDRKMF